MLIIQMIFPRLLLQCFGLSLAAIMLSSIIQTPEEYIDRSTDLYNEEALIKMAARDFSYGINFLCISVILDDITFISNTFGVNQMTKFLSDVADFLKKTFPSAPLFHICTNSPGFAMCVPSGQLASFHDFPFSDSGITT